MARIRTIKPFDLAKMPVLNEAWSFGDSLYLLREEGGPVKVGLCQHPVRRMSTLQCGNPRRLHFVAVFSGLREDCRYIERATLAEFRAVSVRGEWIAAAPQEVLTFWAQWVVP